MLSVAEAMWLKEVVVRVLMLSTNFHPVIGGAESYCRDLATGLAGRGHLITVFTDGGTHYDAPPSRLEQGVMVIRNRSDSGPVTAETRASPWEDGVFRLLPAVADVVGPGAIDLVHANSQDTAILGSIVAAQTGVPLVVTSHEVGRERGPLGQGRCRLVFRHLPVDAHIAVSDYYQRVASTFGARRVHRINLGVDLGRFHPGDRVAARSLWQMPPGEFVVTCIARFKQRKGLLELIEAAARIRTVVPRLRVILAGTTSSGSLQYAARMRARITALGLAGRVRIVEDLSHDQVPQLLRASDVYVQPSHIEGLGLAVVEAMACGVPVVVSDTEGLREVVEPGVSGLMVPVGDSARLADAVVRLAHDGGLRDLLVRGGLIRAQGGFSLARMVTQTEELYERVRGARSVAARVAHVADRALAGRS
ncbi:glycosyltransferase family 4 protein [Actinoplanes sp. CA-054009]